MALQENKYFKKIIHKWSWDRRRLRCIEESYNAICWLRGREGWDLVSSSKNYLFMRIYVS